MLCIAQYCMEKWLHAIYWSNFTTRNDEGDTQIYMLIWLQPLPSNMVQVFISTSLLVTCAVHCYIMYDIITTDLKLNTNISVHIHNIFQNHGVIPFFWWQQQTLWDSENMLCNDTTTAGQIFLLWVKSRRFSRSFGYQIPVKKMDVMQRLEDNS